MRAGCWLLVLPCVSLRGRTGEEENEHEAQWRYEQAVQEAVLERERLERLEEQQQLQEQLDMIRLFTPFVTPSEKPSAAHNGSVCSENSPSQRPDHITDEDLDTGSASLETASQDLGTEVHTSNCLSSLEEQQRLQEQLDMIRHRTPLVTPREKPAPFSAHTNTLTTENSPSGRLDHITDEDLDAGSEQLASPGPPGPQSPEVPKSTHVSCNSSYSAGKESIPGGPDTVSGSAAASLSSSHSSFPEVPDCSARASLSALQSSFTEAPAVDNLQDLDEIEENVLSTVDEEDLEDWKNIQEQMEMAEKLDHMRKQEELSIRETQALIIAEKNARRINEARTRAVLPVRKKMPFIWQPSGPVSYNEDNSQWHQVLEAEEGAPNVQVAQAALENQRLLERLEMRGADVVQWGAVKNLGGGGGAGDASKQNHTRKEVAPLCVSSSGSGDHLVQWGGESSSRGGDGGKVEKEAWGGVRSSGGRDGGVEGQGEVQVQEGAVSNSIPFLQEVESENLFHQEGESSFLSISSVAAEEDEDEGHLPPDLDGYAEMSDPDGLDFFDIQ